jgi:hypothetical protein
MADAGELDWSLAVALSSVVSLASGSRTPCDMIIHGLGVSVG